MSKYNSKYVVRRECTSDRSCCDIRYTKFAHSRPSYCSIIRLSQSFATHKIPIGEAVAVDSPETLHWHEVWYLALIILDLLFPAVYERHLEKTRFVHISFQILSSFTVLVRVLLCDVLIKVSFKYASKHRLITDHFYPPWIFITDHTITSHHRKLNMRTLKSIFFRNHSV
jgi:hypothetical protein